MLHQLGGQGWTELRCESHVSRLLAKLPHDLRASFHRFVNPIHTPIPTLLDLTDWLDHEVRIQVNGGQYSSNSDKDKQAPRKDRCSEHKSQRTTTVLCGTEQKEETEKATTVSANEAIKEKPKKYCPFCDSVQHYMNQCSNFKLLTKEQKTQWIKRTQDVGDVAVSTKPQSVLSRLNINSVSGSTLMFFMK